MLTDELAPGGDAEQEPHGAQLGGKSAAPGGRK
jgi:hypothetical protein